MTIDYTTPVGTIRNYIQDTNESDFEFTDEQLQAFYDTRNEDLPLAIKDALTALTIKYNKDAGDMYRLDTIEYQEGKSKASVFNSLLDKLEKDIMNGMAPGQSLSAHTYGIDVDEYNDNIERINDGELIGPRHSDNEYDTIVYKNQYGPYYGS